MKSKRNDTHVPQSSGPTDNVTDEAIHNKLGDRLATPNESSSQRTNSGGDPRCQETMRDTTAQTRFKSVSKHSNDSLLARGRRIDAIDVDEEITLVNDVDNEMFNVNDLGGEEAKGIVFHEPGKSTTTTPKISSQQSQDKGKGIMIEEHVKPKKKDQIRLDEEATNLIRKKDLQERELKKNIKPIFP
uniref:Uncharacterized protein n=1 Tax=Tanacetum cinerariifolium TaxID=118510 RepID=A0A6L2P6X7_TANCI|nr:hypothetical protein [Tanacetum cinerariifolium]